MPASGFIARKLYQEEHTLRDGAIKPITFRNNWAILLQFAQGEIRLIEL